MVHIDCSVCRHILCLLLPTIFSKAHYFCIPSDVPNILIISENLENRKKQGVTYDVITHRFVGSKLEDQMQLIDTFYTRNATFHLNNNLFPDKLNDLQKRVLRVAMFNYKPYTILTEVVSFQYWKY